MILHTGRLTAGINIQPTNHPFRKEHDLNLNQTSMIMFIMFHVNLLGCRGKLFLLLEKQVQGGWVPVMDGCQAEHRSDHLSVQLHKVPEEVGDDGVVVSFLVEEILLLLAWDRTGS